jgi:transcriptional regulator with XRE-family HTH domain
MGSSIYVAARARKTLPEPSERRRIRVAAGLPQQAIADACGVDQSTVWRWERGEMEPRGEHLVRYVAVLGRLAAIMQSAR